MSTGAGDFVLIAPLNELPQVLLDIGAGLGLFSLAAAARGHRVIAMEASPNSTEALLESIRYNGWQKRITLHHSPAGAVDRRPVCLERGNVHDTDLARGYATAEVAFPAIHTFYHTKARFASHHNSVLSAHARARVKGGGGYLFQELSLSLEACMQQ